MNTSLRLSAVFRHLWFAFYFAVVVVVGPQT